jgi:ABC-type lipoprotein release transport system permease subunit
LKPTLPSATLAPVAGKVGGGGTAPVTLLGRARLRAGLLSLLLVAVLVAITGAAAITALTGAQRTITAYDRLREHTRDPDADVSATRATDVVRRAAQLPDVVDHVFGHIWVSRYLDATDRTVYLSMTGYDRTSDELVRPLVIRGQMWDPSDPHQALLTEATAKRGHVDVGSPIHLKTLTPTQFENWNETDPIAAQGPTVSLRVVGIIRDPFDAGTTGAGLFVSPAFYRYATKAGGPPVGLGAYVRLRDGEQGGDRFASQVEDLVRRSGDPGAGGPGQVQVTLASEREDVTSASRVAALGMMAFAAVAAVAGLVTLTQALGREASRRVEHNVVWAALGMTTRERTLALAGPPELAVIAGTIGAIALSIVASPLSPIGAARTFEPNPGIEANPALLAIGGGGWLLLVSLLVLLSARRGARLAAPTTEVAPATTPSVLTAPVTRANLPAPVAVGLRMAVEQRVGRRTQLMRTPIVTATLAIAAVVATVGFSASLVRLVTEPSRYGWSGDGTVEAPENVRAQTLSRVSRNPDVEAATAVNTDEVSVAGKRTTLYGLDPLRGDLGFTTLTGRAPAAPDEILLGPKLADQLGVTVGDAVGVSTASAKPRVMRVVGYGLTISANGEDYDEGALVTGNTFKRLVRGKAYTTVVYFRLRDSVHDKAAAANHIAGDQELVDPEAPGPIAYLDQLKYLPRLLAGLLAAVGVAAVAHGFLVGSRRWAYDLAVLRVFGFTRKQMAAAVGTMATATVVVGALIGVPLGLIAARLAWTALASDVHVATDLARPVGTLVLLVLAAVAIANGLAAAGAREVRRLRPALALRTE